MRRGHHPGRLMHGQRPVVGPVRRGEAGVQSHARPEHAVGRPRLTEQPPLRVGAGVDGGVGVLERQEHAVAGGVDHMAAVGVPRLRHELEVPVEQVPVAVAQPPQEPRRPLDVGEGERDDAGGQPAPLDHRDILPPGRRLR